MGPEQRKISSTTQVLAGKRSPDSLGTDNDGIVSVVGWYRSRLWWEEWFVS